MDVSGGYDALITDGVNGSPCEPLGKTDRRSQAQRRPARGGGGDGAGTIPRTWASVP